MESMTGTTPRSPEITEDWSQARECPHCGAMLPMRMLGVSVGRITSVPIGHAPCGCEGARTAAEAERADDGGAKARRLERAGIPPRYREASHPWAAKMAAQALDGQGYFVHGPNGTGKTTLAMAAALLLLELDADVLAMSAYDLMDAMRSRRDEDRSLFERAASCRVLVLDDLGKEASNTAYSCERLFAIVDRRDKAMLPTIVTSNFSLSTIARRITAGAVGDAIASRLAASCKQVKLDGDDMRLKGGCHGEQA